MLIIAAFLYVMAMPHTVKAPATQQQTVPATDLPATKTPGAYVDYAADVIAKTPGTKLLFFYAPWCPQCRMLDADITARGVPDGTTIIKTDYDSNQALRQKYGVTIQTTFVRVDDAGNALQKFVAYDDPTLAAALKGVE